MAYGGGRGAAPRPGGAAAGPPPPLDPTLLSLPFSRKERGIADHRARNPHRKYMSDQLTGVTAHWTDAAAGSALALAAAHAPVEIASTECVPPPAAAEQADGGVNVRAFLTCGVVRPEKEQTAKHVLKRLEVVGANTIGAQRQLAAYGGRVAAASDAELTKQLARMVKEQSGMDVSAVKTWHKLVELRYADAPSTVFFVPALSELEARTLKAQEKQEEEKYEVVEEVEEEVLMEDVNEDEEKVKEEKAEEEGKEGEEAEVKKKPKTVKKKVTVEKTRTKKTKLIQPMKFTLATLREFQVNKATGNETCELCAAADSFDEWVRSDTAERLAGVLAQKSAVAEEKAEKQKVLVAEREERKRKREEKQDEMKKQRLEKEATMRAAWDEEDEGKTDDEKQDDEKERMKQLNVLRDAERKAIMKMVEDERDANKAALEPPKKEGYRVKRVTERDAEVFDLFQYLDRSRGLSTHTSQLPRESLVSVLLCTKEERTIGEAVALSTLGGTLNRATPVDYGALAAVERVIEEKIEEEVAKEKPAEAATED